MANIDNAHVKNATVGATRRVCGLAWVSGLSIGYTFAEFARTDGAQYSVDRNDESDDWVAIVLDKNYDNHRRQYFESKNAAKAYCEQVKIERGE